MEKVETKKIEEEIRQYKLYKIQIIEKRIREYRNTFNSINENVIVKLSKNFSSNLFWGVFVLVTILLLFIGIFLLFPEQVIHLGVKNKIHFSANEKNVLLITMPYIGYLFISISILFGMISILLRKNVRKRNTIFSLAILLKEVIDYMDENTKEDKIKYEYYVDTLAEVENRKKEIINNNA